VTLKIKKQQNHQNYGRFRCLLANTFLQKKGELRPKKVLGQGIRKITKVLGQGIRKITYKYYYIKILLVFMTNVNYLG